LHLSLFPGKSRSLMNTAMQLRKCCNHPYLFLDQMEMLPDDPEQRVRASGKFELLDRILPKMKQTGHRILLFSQVGKRCRMFASETQMHMCDAGTILLDF
jgi:SNF2 family DNA or RNA helicase